MTREEALEKYAEDKNLSCTNLRGADLYGADLRGANLYSTNLRGADLRGANLNWTQHELVAEILRQAAGDDIEKLQLAGLILICKDKCWSEFIQIEQVMKLKDWWLEVFRPYFEAHPDNVPSQVKQIIEN